LHEPENHASNKKRQPIHTARAVDVYGGGPPLEEDSTKLKDSRSLAILRTDAVSVSYDANPKQKQKVLESWGKIGGI
jgi:hypothetical protein